MFSYYHISYARWLFIFLTLIAGCSSFNRQKSIPPTLSISIPKQWNYEDSPHSVVTASVISWLDDFRDPNLTALVAEASENNYDLAAFSARMDAAFAQAKIVGAKAFPELGGSLGASRTQRTSSTGFRLTNPRITSHSLNFSTFWELDLWGRLYHQRQASLAEARSSEMTLQAARLSLAIQVAKTWYNALESKQKIELTAKKMENFNHVLAIIQGGFYRGIQSSLDVALAQINVANARYDWERERAVLDATIRTLQVLLGRYPNSQFPIKGDFPALIKRVPAGLPAELLLRRPDLRAAQERFAASQHRRMSEAKNFLPQISLTGSGGTITTELKDLLNFNFLVWSIATNLTQPIFQGGRLKAQRSLAKANEKEALEVYAQSILLAFQEVESSLAMERSLIAQERALEQSRKESKRAEKLAIERYHKGLESVTTLLDIQKRTFDTERLFLEIKNQRLQNRLTIYAALGGDFSLYPK